MTNPVLLHSTMSGPVPGQSLTHEPKSMPYEKPPQHTKMSDAMNMLMSQLTEPEHLKALLNLMESKMSIEAIARTILFTGFSLGKWTPDLGVLMYKPLMMSLIAIAHRAKIKDTPIVMKESLNSHMMNKMKTHVMTKTMNKQDIGTVPPEDRIPTTPQLKTSSSSGFFSKRNA